MPCNQWQRVGFTLLLRRLTQALNHQIYIIGRLSTFVNIVKNLQYPLSGIAHSSGISNEFLIKTNRAA